MLIDLVKVLFVLVFFFKQKTAYEVRISDWSSDVCSSDLLFPGLLPFWAWGALSGLLGATFVLLNRYAIFEAAMKLFIGIMFVVVVGLAILVAPNFGEALGGLVPRLPDGSVIYTLDRKSTRLNSSH